MKIKDLKVNNDEQYLAGLVSQLKEATTKNGSPYVSLKLEDDQDEIDVKIWSTPLSALEEKGIKNGSFVICQGKCGEYKDNKQFTINNDGNLKFRLVVEDDPVNISDYISTGPMSFEDLYAYFSDKIQMVKDEDIKNFLGALYDKYGQELIKVPASIGVHHEFVNGLGYHLFRMMESSIALAKVYKNFVDLDYLIAGVLIHDMGKIRCYKLGPAGPAEDYTLENALLGHIAIGLLMLEEFPLKEDKKNILRHLILSHHGKIEYGAVVQPMTIEAMILHMVDNIDAKVTIMEREIGKLEEGQVSERIWSLDRSKVYKVKFED